MVGGASRAAIKHAAIKQKWSCKHAVMKQNKRALTTHKAGERLSEKRQELIDFRQSLGVPGIALQHRPTSWHVESGRIHRVHLSSVVLDRSSSGRKKKEKERQYKASVPPAAHVSSMSMNLRVQFRRVCNAREISADMLVFTSHALKPLHLNVCPSSTARNTAKSSSSSGKSTFTLIRLKTHSAMHVHDSLHLSFFFFF